jgi:L-malate glycosyltransferase
LNILFVISSLKHGGAEKQTLFDANSLSEKHNVVLVTFKSGELAEQINKNVKLIIIDKEGYLKTAKKLRGIILKEKIEVVNASLFASMIISVLASEKIHIPVIWYFHSHEYDIKLKSKLAFRYFAKKKSLKKILFVSIELLKYLSDKGFSFPEDKADVLYNNYTVCNDKMENKTYKNLITIGYIGRLVKLKRVNYFIELADYLKQEKVDNFKIEIVGDGEERSDLESLTDKLNLNDSISFTGFQKDVEKYYERFDIFALPSEEECLSISLIDAGVKGLPSVAFNVGGNNEILINGTTGYLVNSKEEFFEKMKELLIDCTKRINMGINANKYCVEKFNKINRYEKLENIFKKLH